MLAFKPKGDPTEILSTLFNYSTIFRRPCFLLVKLQSYWTFTVVRSLLWTTLLQGVREVPDQTPENDWLGKSEYKSPMSIWSYLAWFSVYLYVCVFDN